MSAVLDAPVLRPPSRVFRIARSAGRWADRCICIFLFLLLWEALPRLGIVSDHYLSPPSSVLSLIVQLLDNGQLWKHVAARLHRSLW